MNVIQFPTASNTAIGNRTMDLNRILHVDDDEDIRSIVQLALEVVGSFKLLQCADGPSAIAAASNFDPELFLLDVMMPGMSGPQLFEMLRSEHGMKDVPAIFVTAKAEDHFSLQLVENGALAVITKPFDPITLSDQILEIWKSRGPGV